MCALISVAAMAEETNYEVSSPKRMASEDGNVVVMPSTVFSGGDIQQSKGLVVRSTEDESHRTYVVTFDGRRHVASVPKDRRSPPLVFDPEQKVFSELLSSVKVELDDFDRLPQLVQTVDGITGKAYPQLGYAVIRLKSEMHPVQAVQLLKSSDSELSVQLRLKGLPKVVW